MALVMVGDVIPFVFLSHQDFTPKQSSFLSERKKIEILGFSLLQHRYWAQGILYDYVEALPIAPPWSDRQAAETISVP